MYGFRGDAQMDSLEEYLAGHPSAVLSEKSLIPAGMWSQPAGPQIAFHETPAVLTLSSGHRRFDEITKLLGEAINDTKQVRVIVDWNSHNIVDAKPIDVEK